MIFKEVIIGPHYSGGKDVGHLQAWKVIFLGPDSLDFSFRYRVVFLKVINREISLIS